MQEEKYIVALKACRKRKVFLEAGVADRVFSVAGTVADMEQVKVRGYETEFGYGIKFFITVIKSPEWFVNKTASLSSSIIRSEFEKFDKMPALWAKEHFIKREEETTALEVSKWFTEEKGE